MAHTQPPNKAARDQEPQRQQREEGKCPTSLPHQVPQGPILHHGNGHNGGGKEEDALAVDVKRVFSVGTQAVGENIHELQPLHGEKAQRGIHQERTEKEQASAQDHGQQNHPLGECPDKSASPARGVPA